MCSMDAMVGLENPHAWPSAAAGCSAVGEAVNTAMPGLGTSPFDDMVQSSVRDRSRCTCCPPLTDLSCNLMDTPPRVRTVSLLADPCEVSNNAISIETALLSVFGEDGLELIFGCRDSTGAKRIAQGGMNHLFMVALNGKLAKCMRPPNTWASEASEAEYLRAAQPGLLEDVHALFPLASFVCEAAPGSPAAASAQKPEVPCELLVFEYLEGCRPVDDIILAFQRTHASGVLQNTAVCTDFRKNGTCDHIPMLRQLLVKQLPMLGRRFHSLYGRRHGDFKVGNVMLERDGNLRLADFLSPFCRNCDCEEFLASTKCLHNVVMECRDAFCEEWSQLVSHSSALEQEDVEMNLNLLNALEELDAARLSSGNSLFGPMPSLLDSIPDFGLKVPPALNFADNSQQGVEVDGSASLCSPMSPSFPAVSPSFAASGDAAVATSLPGVGLGFSLEMRSPRSNPLFQNALEGNPLLQSALEGKMPQFDFHSKLEGNPGLNGGPTPTGNAGACPPSLPGPFPATGPGARDSFGGSRGSSAPCQPWPPMPSAQDATPNSASAHGVAQPRVLLPAPTLGIGGFSQPALGGFSFGQQPDAPHWAPVLPPASDGSSPQASAFGLQPPQLTLPIGSTFAPPVDMFQGKTMLSPTAMNGTFLPPQGGWGNFSPMNGAAPLMRKEFTFTAA